MKNVMIWWAPRIRIVLATVLACTLSACPRGSEPGGKGTAPGAGQQRADAGVTGMAKETPADTRPTTAGSHAAPSSLVELLQAGDVEGAMRAAKERKLPLPTSVKQLLPVGKEWVFVLLKYQQLKHLMLELLLPSPCETAKATAGKLLSGIRSKGRDLLGRAKGEPVPKKGTLPGVLHLAALTCADKIMPGLVKVGINASARDCYGLTPLHYVSCGHAARALIKLGADVNSQSARGLTPLHLAINVAVASALLENGAKIHARDECENTPLHLVMDLETQPPGAPVAEKDAGAPAPARDARSSGAVGSAGDSRVAAAHPAVRWLLRQAVRLGRKILHDLNELPMLLDVASYLRSKGAQTELKNWHGQTPAEARAAREKRSHSDWDD